MAPGQMFVLLNGRSLYIILPYVAAHAAGSPARYFSRQIATDELSEVLQKKLACELKAHDVRSKRKPGVCSEVNV